MINKTSYDYVVFYYSLAEMASGAILNDLYSQKSVMNGDGTDNTDAALSTEETDFISNKLQEAFASVSQKLARWRVDGLLSYEYGKLNIAPTDDTTGDIVLFRVEFELYQKTEEMYNKIDQNINDFVLKYIRSKWATLTGLPNWQLLQSEFVQAGNELDDAMAYRNTPPERKYQFY